MCVCVCVCAQPYWRYILVDGETDVTLSYFHSGRISSPRLRSALSPSSVLSCGRVWENLGSYTQHCSCRPPSLPLSPPSLPLSLSPSLPLSLSPSLPLSLSPSLPLSLSPSLPLSLSPSLPLSRCINEAPNERWRPCVVQREQSEPILNLMLDCVFCSSVATNPRVTVSLTCAPEHYSWHFNAASLCHLTTKLVSETLGLARLISGQVIKER